MARINYVFVLLILLLVQHVPAQSTYKFLISFTDKNNSSYSTSNPSQFLSERAIARRQRQNIPINTTDIPVNKNYLDSCTVRGATVLYALNWFNAAVILADSSVLASIKTLPFVKSDKLLHLRKGGTQQSLADPLNYGNSYNQLSMLGADLMHQDGLNGEGMVIAIFDAGFQNADVLDVFTAHVADGQILSTWDFVEQEADVYDDHYHGTHCFSICGGYKDGDLIGPAYKASYHLLVTEDDALETELEEMNWARAAQYADSAGADIISSSLGYNTFDNDINSHSYADLDGNKTLITQAADAAASKGMIVVNSAGNEGNKPWKYILAPADGDSVVAVGAVDFNRNYAALSSRGPSADGRIKPDLAAKGQGTTFSATNNVIMTGNGTSYACPLIAGFMAALWQGSPEYTNMELIEVVKQSASQYRNPDDKLGYGIPSYAKAKAMIKNDAFAIYPNPGSGTGEVQLLVPHSELYKTVELDFYNTQGKKVFTLQEYASAPTLYLQLSMLPTALYYLRIHSGELETGMKYLVE